LGQELPPDLPAGRRGALTWLVTRLLVTRLPAAQAAAAGAIGLFFSLGRPGLGHPGLGQPGLGRPGLGHPGPADRELGQA
jgi:hypothetical protein